jgi:hypothetical protein
MAWTRAELDSLVVRLAGLHDQALRRQPPPPPGAPSARLAAAATGYEAAQHELGARERRLAALADLGDQLAEELLPPPAAGGEDAELVDLFRALQRTLFRHPLAFRAAFAALAAEGRRFAGTPEGEACRQRLAASELLPRARLFGRMLGFSMLEEDEPERLPSAYLEGLFRLAGHPDADRVLDRLFGGEGEGGPRR